MKGLNKIYADRTIHCVAAGEGASKAAVDMALIYHHPLYESDSRRRTRITLVLDSLENLHDFLFEYRELLDNSYWRVVDLRGEEIKPESHRPMYAGQRKDFVDVEWEFVIGRFSHPALQSKIELWSRDTRQQLLIALCYADTAKSARYAAKLRGRLPAEVVIETVDPTQAENPADNPMLVAMAKYLNYCYKVSYDEGIVPTELPEEAVEKAWEELADERMRLSNIYNVRSIPFKMLLLGHDMDDWDKFYALSADEIERLTAVEHNRWSVDRLIQGVRPCTDEERMEIAADISLKRRYARERGAHFDLCAFTELGVDETGLPVTRYDRDLTAAIPLIVKTYADRHANGQALHTDR